MVCNDEDTPCQQNTIVNKRDKKKRKKYRPLFNETHESVEHMNQQTTLTAAKNEVQNRINSLKL